VGKLQEERRAAGLCSRCGEPPMPGKSRCKLCADAHNLQNRDRAIKRAAAGRCPKCGGRPVEGKSHCQRCTDGIARRSATRYSGLKSRGICIRCREKPAAGGAVTCKDCIDGRKDRRDKLDAERYEARKAAGLCFRCGEPAMPGNARCRDCIDTHAAQKRKRRAERARLVFAHYGTVCKCCRQDWPIEMLQISHAGDCIPDDVIARRGDTKPSRFRAWLIEQGFPPGFITLCANCSQAWWYSRCCPHAIERLVTETIDDETIYRDPQTGKVAWSKEPANAIGRYR
jgi:hypothetical protein